MRVNPVKVKKNSLDSFLEWDQLEPQIPLTYRIRRAWLAGYKASELEQNRKYKIICNKLGI